MEHSTSDVDALDTTVDPSTREQWRALVAGVLNKGRAPDQQLSGEQAEERLRSHLLGGLVVDPLYLRADAPGELASPGQAPFTRGRVVRDARSSWDVRQFHDDPDASASRAAVLADLEHGVSSVWVHCGAGGVDPADLTEVLADVRLDLAPVVVSSVSDQGAAAAALLRVADGASGALAGISLGLDPIGAAARVGGSPQLAGLADAVRAAVGRSGVRAFTVDTRVYHDAGASDVDEIAYAVATGVEYLRLLESAGLAVADAFGQIEFRVAATADQFLTAARLRALRLLWSRIGEVCGVAPERRGAWTHAVTSERMLTRDDPWVNILRGTLACFGASLGGADAITVLPFDHVAGLPSAFSRRVARNTQALLADESNVGRVTDPAGGSWYVESLTADLAERAWAAFQSVERAGGMAAALADGTLGRQVEATVQERAALLSNRRLPMTGVSTFPMAGEQPLERRPRSGLSTSEGALPARRDSAAYEALRDRATALGDAATVTLTRLGAQRDFGARELFVTNLLAAGGISTTSDPTPVVVLASSRAGYTAHADAAITAARDAGAERVLIAGRATELPEGASVDGEVFDGMDVVAFLGDLLTRLEAAVKGAAQ